MINKYIKLISYIGPFKKRRLFILFICSINIAVASFIPYFIGNLINYIQASKNLDIILKQGIIAIILALISAILDSYQNYKWHMFSVEYLNYFRTILLKSALSKDSSFYNDKNEDYSTRILQDSLNIAADISIGFPMLILNIFRLAIVVFLMLKMNVKLTLVPITIIPIYILIFNIIDKDLRVRSKDERNQYSVISRIVKEYLDGIFEIKINNKENYFLNKFKEKINDYTKILKKIRYLMAISYGISSIITNALPIIVLLIGGFMVYKGELLLGYLFSFYAYLDFLYEPMNNLIDWYTNINISLGMSDRILDFLNEDKEDKEGKNIDQINDINVSNLYFKYNEKEILSNISFNLKKGDCLAVIGNSGSGKSTLIEIILKNLTSYNGDIKINGINIDEIDKKAYYSKVSFVSQEVTIFSDSLKNNISFDEKLALNSKVIFDAKLTNILESKKSLDSQVTKDTLSGGEKQRIAIARILYKNSDLIILDEFTSSLDYDNEKSIVDTFMKMDNKDKIYIIISHRKYPLKMANKILNLNTNEFYEKL